MINAQIIADSVDPRGNRLTTFVLTFPRIILAEFNTHRMFCLAGDTLLNFDLPSKNSKSGFKKYSMTIEEFVKKWHFGVKSHKVGSLKNFDLSKIDKYKIYTAKELSQLVGMKSSSNIRTWCRKDKLLFQNQNKKRSEDFLIKGSDFIDTMLKRGDRSFDIKKRLSNMNIRQLDENTGKIRNSRVINCTFSGEKQLYKLSLNNGNFLRCSKDHKILTEEGWKTLENITIDDYIITQTFGTFNNSDTYRYKIIDGRWVNQWVRKCNTVI